jgi:hypothetical protein
MKKVTALLTLICLSVHSFGFADQTGKGASVSSQASSDSQFAWGIAIGAIAVLGVIVGLTVSSATSSSS